MQRLSCLTLFTALTTLSIQGVAAEPIGVSFMLDELEYIFDDGADPIAWSAALAIGNSERQLWLVSEGGHNRGALGRARITCLCRPKPWGVHYTDHGLAG